MDYISSDEMLLGGEINFSTSYPYFENYQFTGRTQWPRYIADSSLKRIRSIKYHANSASNVTYYMLFETTPIKLGASSHSGFTQNIIYEIPDFKNLRFKPSTMSKDTDGYLLLAGTSLDQVNGKIIVFDFGTAAFQQMSIPGIYMDTLSTASSGTTFVAGQDIANNLTFYLISGSALNRVVSNQTVQDSSSLTIGGSGYEIQDTNSKLIGNNYYQSTCLASTTSLLFINLIYSQTYALLVQQTTKSLPTSVSSIKCISILSQSSTMDFVFMHIDSNMALGMLNYSSGIIGAKSRDISWVELRISNLRVSAAMLALQ